MKGKGLHILLIIISVTCVSNGARIIYVDDDGAADFGNIQAAIDDANNGDTILIAEGIYTGSGNYNIDFKGKAITVRSIDPNDPNVVSNTIIDPNKAGRGFYFHSGEDSNCVISGLTIRNAQIAGYGAGIYCVGSSPAIVNCTVTNSSAQLGGGVYCYDSNSQFKGCTFSNNYSISDGAGMECWWGTPELINCIISNNHAEGNGGGIDCWMDGNTIITNCSIVTNQAFSGAGIYCDYSEIISKSTILWANNSNIGEQLALVNDSSASVSYCNVQGGEDEIYIGTGCTLIWDSNSNINADPCFASFDPNGDPNLWDFHLQSSYGRWDPNSEIWVTDSNTSLCIDAGDPNSGWSGEPWPNGKRINMGAYGGTGQASMNGSPGDFNIDGEVNFEDFSELAGKWGCEGSFIENLNNNGIVDFTDLSIFVEDWLWYQE